MTNIMLFSGQTNRRVAGYENNLSQEEGKQRADDPSKTEPWEYHQIEDFLEYIHKCFEFLWKFSGMAVIFQV